VAEALSPDLVIRVGGVPVSKALLHFLAVHAEVPQIVVDPGGAWSDPLHSASAVVRCDATWLCSALLDRLSDPAAGGPSGEIIGWLDRWRWVSSHTRDAVRAVLRRHPGLSEPRAILELSALLPTDTTLVVGNSMPVRDLDSFLPNRSRPLRVLANRGASGIDGVVSTGLGVAAAGRRPTVILLGDISLYHDLNGLLAAGRFGLDATIVVFNNDGGGIFSLLPQADIEEGFEELFGTPHGLDFSHAAALYGLDFHRPDEWRGLRRAVNRAVRQRGVTLIELRTDRKANAALHAELWHAVAAAVSAGTVWSWGGRVGRRRRGQRAT
jgi:2-succinyl-5-enolpyruvyl-6-hydroxy-3-cyclohexene-1-carboxylate synthase